MPERRPSGSRSFSFLGFGLIVVALGLAIAFIKISADRQLTPLENTLFQTLALAAGLTGSYLFGLKSAETTARELLRPAAKSAFRRVLWLYGSLERLARTLDERSGDDAVQLRMKVARAILREQLASASDSMEDWRDLVPDEVADVERKLRTSTEPSQRSSE